MIEMKGSQVSNIEAAWVAGLIIVLVLADLALNAGQASLFLVLKLFDLIDYLMFWR